MDLDSAISELKLEFAGNSWFTEFHWPENRERTVVMVSDVAARYPLGSGARVLDVGCANGYMSFLFARLGYAVTGTDSWHPADVDGVFWRAGAGWFESNLNKLHPFPHISPGSFDVVLMGEVIEHVLNHPLGLMQSVNRILTPGGLLILSTPNPSTIMNATRILLDRWSLWGTPEFMDEPKISDGEVISRGDIHYREYRTSEVCRLLKKAEFSVAQIRYMGMGASPRQPWIKRFVKDNPLAKPLMTRRLFACAQYFVATKLV